MQNNDPWKHSTWRSVFSWNPARMYRNWRTRRQIIQDMEDDFDTEFDDDNTAGIE